MKKRKQILVNPKTGENLLLTTVIQIVVVVL